MHLYTISMLLYEVRLIVSSYYCFKLLIAIGFIDSLMTYFIEYTLKYDVTNLPVTVRHSHIEFSEGLLYINDITVHAPSYEIDPRWHNNDIIKIGCIEVHFSLLRYGYAYLCSAGYLLAFNTVIIKGLYVYVEGYYIDENDVYGRILSGESMEKLSQSFQNHEFPRGNHEVNENMGSSDLDSYSQSRGESIASSIQELFGIEHEYGKMDYNVNLICKFDRDRVDGLWVSPGPAVSLESIHVNDNYAGSHNVNRPEPINHRTNEFHSGSVQGTSIPPSFPASSSSSLSSPPLLGGRVPQSIVDHGHHLPTQLINQPPHSNIYRSTGSTVRAESDCFEDLSSHATTGAESEQTVIGQTSPTKSDQNGANSSSWLSSTFDFLQSLFITVSKRF